MTFNAEDFKHYLKFDQWDVNQFVCLMTNEKPGSGLYRRESYDFTWDQTSLNDMAEAAIKAGKIKGTSKNSSDFGTSPKEWIEWAIRKGLTLPEGLIEAYKKYKPENEQKPRTNESFRPRDESGDKIGIIAVMKVINRLFPELPIEKLILLKPIQELVGTRYKKETLIAWAKKSGITNKSGRPSRESKEICLQKIPEEWGFVWD